MQCHVDVPHQCPKSIHNHGVGSEIARQLYEGLLDLPAAEAFALLLQLRANTSATAIDPLCPLVPVSPAPEG